MKKQPLVSIVIPCYNVEKYVKKCISSVTNQTYGNLEIVIVNDGSSDNTGKIINQFKDRRIKIINQKNGGLSSARNSGIKAAKGELICFIDGDDYIDTHFIEVLVKDMDDNDADIAACDFKKVYEDKTSKSPKILSGKTYSNIEALEKMLYFRNISNSAWGKMYKSKLFDSGIIFPVGKRYEDLATIYKLFALANRVVINKSKLYYYLQRNESIIHEGYSHSRIDGLEFAREETKFIKEKYPKIIKSAINREFIETIFILETLYPKRKEHPEDYEKVLKIMKETCKTVIFDRKARIRYRIIALMPIFYIKMLTSIVK